MEKLDSDLDEIFSIFTRMRFADWKGEVHCYTCTWYGHWKELDAGHFIKRAHQAVRWEENNARPQCRDCNRQCDGMETLFEEELRWEIGDEAVAKLKHLSLRTKYLDDFEKGQLLVHYKILVKGLKAV